MEVHANRAAADNRSYGFAHFGVIGPCAADQRRLNAEGVRRLDILQGRMPRAGSDRSAGFVRRRRETGAGVCGRSHDAFALESASSDSRVAHGRSTKHAPDRSEERRVGEECVSRCNSRVSQSNSSKKTHKTETTAWLDRG